MNLSFSDEKKGRTIDSEKFYQRWVYLHAVLNTCGLLLLIWQDFYPAWLGFISLSFLIFIIDLKKTSSTLHFQPLGFGYPNLITTLRLTGLLILAFGFNALSDLTCFVAFNLVILMDGLDGFLARKLNQCSKQGERFDAEADAQLVCLLSWIHFSNGTIDWWILIPGTMRYVYQIFFFWIPPGTRFPSKKIRATVAVIFFFSLSFTFILERELATYLLMAASVLITLSFGGSLCSGIIQLLRPKNPR